MDPHLWGDTDTQAIGRNYLLIGIEKANPLPFLAYVIIARGRWFPYGAWQTLAKWAV